MTRLQPPSLLPEPSWACPHFTLAFPGAQHALLDLGTFIFVPSIWNILPPSLLNFPLTFQIVSQSLLCAPNALRTNDDASFPSVSHALRRQLSE